jgi:hypothetical protein
MKRDYYPANKSAREIQNEIELIRRLTPRNSAHTANGAGSLRPLG